jgi:FlgD Ig-like domain
MQHRTAFLTRALVWLLLAMAIPAYAQSPDDILYRSRHPRLLFTAADLPALRARVHDGGPDDAAYAFIRSQFESVYVTAPFDSLIRNDFAQEQITNIGLAAHLEASVDSVALDLGKRLTLYIARTWDVDTDPYGSALRLRALALGYDMCFGAATSEERTEVLTEAESYVSYMTTNLNYDIWLHSPYVSNKTAMVAAALGLAAIAFHDEMGDAIASPALAKAHEFYTAWHDAQLGDDGCYREGSLYGCWSLRNLVYYFEARKRFDGFDYSLDPALRNIEHWLPYELDPRGDARMNNIQDQTDYFRPLARHATYFEWALSEWASPLSAYLWDHSEGAYGRDMGDEADKAATVLWHRQVTPVNPSTVLPKSWLSTARGLYYYRSGWPDGASSDDVVFSFYSGEFHGGHAQEDQNQFTLAAFGEKLVLDHGSGSIARQSEAHNLVLIDGAGEHNAGSSIGTDGHIVEYLSSEFADYVCGDATEAYTTHSPYNNPGVPYPWSDWSWGDSGSNPVQRALRRVLVVHGSSEPTYVFVQDDIRKDDSVHRYDWCLHVPAAATVDTDTDPILVTTANADLAIHRVNPPASLVTTTAAPFDNGSEDPNSTRLDVAVDAINPVFGFILVPRRSNTVPEFVSTVAVPWGTVSVVTWPGGVLDVLYARTNWSSPQPLIRIDESETAAGPISTDAGIGLIRTAGGEISRYIAVDATSLVSGTVELVRVNDGPLTVAYDGKLVIIDRADADFRIYAGTATDVFANGERVPTARDVDYFTSTTITGAGAAPAITPLSVRAYPNPFNPAVRISYALAVRSRVSVELYDVSGRRVTTLASGIEPVGQRVLEWNGTDDAGRSVSSGVYFVRVRAGGATETVKLVLLR